MTTTEVSDDTRLVVQISTDEAVVVDRLVHALHSADGLYQRSGQLVRVRRDSGRRLRGLIRQPQAPRIEPLPLPQLRRELTRVARCQKFVGGCWMDAHPPAWAVDEVATLADWPTVPNLEAVVESPVLRPDGSVIQRLGYDDMTGILFSPPDGVRYPAVPERPTAQNVRQAIDRLLDVFVDFPLRNPAHLSGVLAGILTYFARFQYQGCTPIMLVDANTSRAGKGLLIEVVGQICLGRDMDLSPYTSDENEMRKSLLSIAASGDLMVLLDNIDGPFGCAALDAAVTSTQYSDRQLATNTRPSYPWLTTIWANGNNVQFRRGCDTTARTQWIRLDVSDERPQERSQFKYLDLPGHVRKHRAELASAACTILRAYHCAGRPTHNLPRWGRFEAWSRVVRECIAWCGLHDPYDTQSELRDAADNTLRLVKDLVDGVRDYCTQNKTTEFTVREMVEDLQSEQEHANRNGRAREGWRYPQLLGALQELCSTPSGRLAGAHQISRSLARYRGRYVGGYCIDTLGKKTNQGQIWVLKRLADSA